MLLPMVGGSLIPTTSRPVFPLRDSVKNETIYPIHTSCCPGHCVDGLWKQFATLTRRTKPSGIEGEAREAREATTATATTQGQGLTRDEMA